MAVGSEPCHCGEILLFFFFLALQTTELMNEVRTDWHG